MKTRLENAPNPLYGTAGGSVTYDHVFCLSLDEVNKYMKGSSSGGISRLSVPTYYASNNGATAHNTGTCWWWLRSPGNYWGNAACIQYNGEVIWTGDYIENSSMPVRPAIIYSN